MSTTVTVETTVDNNNVDLARFRFIDPDTSLDPWKCDYFAIARPKNLKLEILPLHDIRSIAEDGEDIPRLSTHGFEAVRHESSLFRPPYNRDSFNDPTLLEDVYLPEICDLLRKVTGASRTEVISCGTRQKQADPLPKLTSEVSDPNETPEKCGVPLDALKVDLNKPFIAGHGKEGNLGPARAIHVDYSPSGARKMLRNLRPSLKNAALDIIAAEDSVPPVPTLKTRRYAFFSVWRPLKPVINDPLAVCDGRTVDPSRDLVEFVNKHPNPEGKDFLAGALILNGHNAKKHKFYWIKNQKPDHVLVIQFFDSHAEAEERPIGTPHGSPEVLGLTEMERNEPRESIEVRIAAFWD